MTDNYKRSGILWLLDKGQGRYYRDDDEIKHLNSCIIDYDKSSDLRPTTGSEGYCETCKYEFPALEATIYCKCGKLSSLLIDTSGLNFGDIIKTISSYDES